MSAPVYSVPLTYAPPVSPHFTSTPQPPQPPTPSPVEQAILNLSKQVDNFIEEQRGVTVHANKEIDTVESSLNKKIDGLQSEMELKLDNLQCSIFKLANQLVHQDEENLEGEWLTDQEEVMQEPVEALEELPTGEAGGGRGKEAGEEPQKPILQQIPMNLNPIATAQATKNPLLVYILPLPAAQPIPKAPTKQLITAYAEKLQEISGHCTEFCHYLKEDGSCSHRLAQWLVRVPVRIWSIRTSAFLSSPPLFVLICLVLFYFIVFYFDFLNFSS